MPSSQLEEWCRSYFEEKFRVEFPNRRPSFLKNPKTNRNLELDGYNIEMCLSFEAQGLQHYKRVSKFQRTQEDFNKQVEHDLEKQLKCFRKGIRLVIIPPLKSKTEVYRFLDMQFMDPRDLALNELTDDLVHITIEDKPKKKVKNSITTVVKKTPKSKNYCVIS